MQNNSEEERRKKILELVIKSYPDFTASQSDILNPRYNFFLKVNPLCNTFGDQSRMSIVKSYIDSLVNSSKEELDSKYHEEIALPRAKQEEAKNKWYKSEENRIDYEYWLKIDALSISEAAAFILGIEPKIISLSPAMNPNLQIVNEYKKYYKLIEAACKCGKLNDPITPNDLIQWAKDKNIQLPNELKVTNVIIPDKISVSKNKKRSHIHSINELKDEKPLCALVKLLGNIFEYLPNKKRTTASSKIEKAFNKLGTTGTISNDTVLSVLKYAHEVPQKNNPSRASFLKLVRLLGNKMQYSYYVTNSKAINKVVTELKKLGEQGITELQIENLFKDAHEEYPIKK